MPIVEQSKWEATANLLSRAIHGQPARLEIADQTLGDQIEAEWSPLEGVSYDPKDDLFEIQLKGLDHLVSHPREFAIRARGGMTDSFAVIDGEGAEHIVQLREPIALPPPA